MSMSDYPNGWVDYAPIIESHEREEIEWSASRSIENLIDKRRTEALKLGETVTTIVLKPTLHNMSEEEWRD